MGYGYRFFRGVAYALEILVFFVVQQTPGLIPEIAGARPMLLLPVVVAIALFETEFVGLWFGLFAGVLLDVGLWSIVGFWAIIFAALGYFVGFWAVRFLQSNFLTMMIVSVIAIVIVYGLYFLFGFLLHFYAGTQYALLRHFLPRMAYTLALAPVFYFFNRALVMKLSEKE